jgi:SpoVK/Ycf46/Vps4 family AAA+-type ATPase
MRDKRALFACAADAHRSYIHALKEMVFLPLLYPDLFQNLGVQVPRGVLFHGPPGTGKTAMARALAGTCNKSDRKVAFFMRKGSDVLSKWLGETERQLRLLFDEAKRLAPSIIFFDEIDGLAPVRSARQDYVHSSVVSTLLAMMDGLDTRGQVVVIGATNRIDAIDPALRRPGRFDRELYFPLPSEAQRSAILKLELAKLRPPIAPDEVASLAAATAGFCGADLHALCSEAALRCLRRVYPQVYESDLRLAINPKKVAVSAADLHSALSSVKAASHRVSFGDSRPLPPNLRLLECAEAVVDHISSILDVVFPQFALAAALSAAPPVPGLDLVPAISAPPLFRPKLVVTDTCSAASSLFLPAAFHRAEQLPVFSLGAAELHGQAGRVVEEVIVSTVHQAQRMAPSILYIPDFHTWVESVSSSAQCILVSVLSSLPVSTPILLVACGIARPNRSLVKSYPAAALSLQDFFSDAHAVTMPPIASPHLQEIFLVETDVRDALKRELPRRAPRPLPVLQVAPQPLRPPLSALDRDQALGDEYIITEMRGELRLVLERLLRTKRFTSLLDLHKVSDNANTCAAAKSETNADESPELRKTRSGAVIKSAEDESRRKRLKALSKSSEVTSVVQLLRLVNCGAFECMSAFLQALERYLKALLHARGVDSSGEVEEGQEHDEEWAYVSLVFEMGDCVRAACFKIDRRLVRECEAAALRRADAEAAVVSASESSVAGSGKGRVFQPAVAAPINFDALDKFLRENKNKRFVESYLTLPSNLVVHFISPDPISSLRSPD